MRALGGIALVMAASGCMQAVYPPYLGDAAPRGRARPTVGLTTEAPREDPPCDREVPFVDARIARERPHRELSRISVTCGVGLVQDCDERLRRRACNVGADAIVRDDEGGTPVTGRLPSASAALVRWNVPAH